MTPEGNLMLQAKAKANFILPKPPHERNAFEPVRSARPLPFHYGRHRAVPAGRPLEEAIKRAAKDQTSKSIFSNAARPPMAMPLSIMSLVVILGAMTIGFAALVQNRHSAAVIFGVIDRIATMEPISVPRITEDNGHPAKAANRDAVPTQKLSD